MLRESSELRPYGALQIFMWLRDFSELYPHYPQAFKKFLLSLSLVLQKWKEGACSMGLGSFSSQPQNQTPTQNFGRETNLIIKSALLINLLATLCNGTAPLLSSTTGQLVFNLLQELNDWARNKKIYWSQAVGVSPAIPNTAMAKAQNLNKIRLHHLVVFPASRISRIFHVLQDPTSKGACAWHDRSFLFNNAVS